MNVQIAQLNVHFINLVVIIQVIFLFYFNRSYFVCYLELTVGNLERHAIDSVHNHLLLVTTRVTEQQQVIVRLHKKVNDTFFCFIIHFLIDKCHLIDVVIAC